MSDRQPKGKGRKRRKSSDETGKSFLTSASSQTMHDSKTIFEEHSKTLRVLVPAILCGCLILIVGLMFRTVPICCNVDGKFQRISVYSCDGLGGSVEEWFLFGSESSKCSKACCQPNSLLGCYASYGTWDLLGNCENGIVENEHKEWCCGESEMVGDHEEDLF